MSKIIISLSKKWPGTVTIHDRFVLSQVELIEDALDSRPVLASHVRAGEGGKPEIEEGYTNTSLDKPRLPAIMACVEKWDLKDFPENVTMETFPLTPRRAAHELIMQIWNEITLVYIGELEVPNE